MGKVFLALGVFAASILGLYFGRRLQEETQARKSKLGPAAASSRHKKSGPFGLNRLMAQIGANLADRTREAATRQFRSWVDDGSKAVSSRWSKLRNRGKDDDRSQN